MSNVMPCLTFYAEAEVVYDSSDSDKKDKKEKEEDTKDKIRATLNNKDYYLILSRSMALNLSSYFAPLLEIITPPPEHIS